MAPSTTGSAAGTRRTELGLVALTAIAAAAAWPTLWTAVDDAFISARYAEHLALGHGWTWNAAGPAVEGFSNPLWTAWIAVGLALNADIHGWMVLSGLVGWILAIPASWGLARTLAEDRPGIGLWLAPLALALSPLAAVAATNGLETSWWLVGLLLASWAAVAARALPRELGAGLALGMLCWLRPEAVLAGPLWIAYRAARGRPVAGLVVGWGTGLALLLGWRAWTFGALLPNTVGAKFGGHRWDITIDRNTTYLLRDPLTWLALAGAAVGVAIGGRRRPEVLAPLALGVLLVLPALTVELWMPGGRLLLPALLGTAVSGAVLVADRPRLAGVGLVLVLIGALPGAWRGARLDDRAHSVLPDNGAARAGRWLREHAPAGASLAIRDAGCLAFNAGPGITVYENHERTLTRPETGGLRPEAMESPPTFLVLTQAREDAEGIRYPSDRRLVEAFGEERYRLLGRVHQHHHRYYDLYALRSVPLPPFPADLVVPGQPLR